MRPEWASHRPLAPRGHLLSACFSSDARLLDSYTTSSASYHSRHSLFQVKSMSRSSSRRRLQCKPTGSMKAFGETISDLRIPQQHAVSKVWIIRTAARRIWHAHCKLTRKQDRTPSISGPFPWPPGSLRHRKRASRVATLWQQLGARRGRWPPCEVRFAVRAPLWKAHYFVRTGTQG